MHGPGHTEPGRKADEWTQRASQFTAMTVQSSPLLKCYFLLYSFLNKRSLVKHNGLHTTSPTSSWGGGGGEVPLEKDELMALFWNEPAVVCTDIPAREGHLTKTTSSSVALLSNVRVSLWDLPRGYCRALATAHLPLWSPLEQGWHGCSWTGYPSAAPQQAGQTCPSIQAN